MATSIIELSNETVNIVATTIIEEDGKYLMVQEGKPEIYGKWNFPSGKADIGETIFESAVREAKEETGLTVELLGVREVVYEQWETGNGVSVRFIFQGKTIKGELSPLDKDVLQMQWKTKEELLSLKEKGLLRSKFTERLVGLIEKNQNTYPLEIIYCFTNDFKKGNLISA